MTIKMEGWKISDKIPYPLFASQSAVYIEDAKGHPVALVDVEIANLLKAAPWMREALKEICRTYRVEPNSKPEDWDSRGSHGWAAVVKALAEARGEGKQ